MEQAERLVRVPSVTLQEQEVCQLFERQLRDLGLEVDVREVTPGRPNLYARVKGTGGGPTLMLNGHLDTIPNQNNQPVYRDGDLLYGRDTTDMKDGMAAILGAAFVVAVATGGSSHDELRACEPDLLLDDLTDADALLAEVAAAQQRCTQLTAQP